MVINNPYFIEHAKEKYSERSNLEGKLDTDLLIVGSGINGLATAYELINRIPGSRITIIESERVGFATSGKSSGLLADSVEEDYSEMEKNVYTEVAKGQKSIVELIQKERLDCGFKKIPSLYIATDSKEQIDKLEKEFIARTNSGFKVNLLRKDELQQGFGISAEGAMKNLEGYCMDPASFCQELAKVLENLGVKIYERTKLTKYDVKTKNATTETGEINYNKLILTNSNPRLENVPFRDKALLLSTAVAVTVPLNDEQYNDIFGKGEYMGWDAPDNNYMYFRPVGNNRILIGGSDRLVSRRSVRKNNALVKKEEQDRVNVRKLFEKTFPGLKDVSFSNEWTGVIPASIDSLSLVGEFQPDHFIGLYGGGLPISYRSGQVLAEQINGDVKKSTLFDHKRKMPIANRIRALGQIEPCTTIANWMYF